ncbi:glycine zipper 2TM domain-containing protein [Sphingorhabdus sp.]|uniref:glycine zipper 2TM domain-containing protein n=1 Tax=Sphingorhabdus sp. TaxID=1902408 RepID=UPI00398323F2
MKKTLMVLAAAALVVPTGAVLADPPGHAKAWGYKNKKGKAYERGYREGRRDAQAINGYTRMWRGDDGRYYCKRDDGTTGLIIGAAVGGLAGNEIAGRGDKTLGAILGAAGGALLGREIDRSNYRCR